MGPDAAVALAGVAGSLAVAQERRSAAILLGAFAIAGCWLWLQWPQLALLPGDEPLYLLDAQRLLGGGKLYSDIFLAHPPARVWQAALVLALGAPIAWAKFWAPLATLGTALLLTQVPRQGEKVAAPELAAFVFLTTSVVMTHGAMFVGVEQALFFATAATALALHKRWLLAGFLLALGTQWALHIGILAVPMLVWAYREKTLKLFALGLTLGLLPLLLEFVWFGQPMIDQVLGYHLRKVTAMAAQKVPDRVWPFAKGQLPLMLLAAWTVRVGAPLQKRIAVSALGVIAVLLLWPRLQPYYFLLPLPWLALAAAYAVQDLRAGRTLWRRGTAWALLTLTGVPAVGNAYLRREATLAIPADMTQLSAQVQTLAQGQPIWGDGALVPLLSLKTGLPVALADTDLNAQRFLSGVTPPAEHLSHVLAKKPLIILVPRHGIDLVPEIHQRLLQDCEVVGQFNVQAANFSGLLLRPR
jgi:hypothetical protein